MSVRRERRLRGLACSTVLAALVGCAPATQSGLRDAHRAFIAHDLGRAERLYREVAATGNAPATDRAQALRRLATLTWRYYDLGPDTARAVLDLALSLGADSSATLAELARLETVAGNTAAAMVAAEAALETAANEEDRVRAEARLAAAAVEPAMTALLDQGSRPNGEALARLRTALERLQPLNAATPGLLETSRLQLLAALLLDDGDAALAGWRSYYLLHLERGGPLPGALDTLSGALPAWAGPRASSATRAAVVRAFAASGRYDAALILAADPRAAARLDTLPAIADVVAYARFLRRLRSLTDAYYRATSVGAGDADAYRETVYAEGAELWQRLQWPGEPPPLDERSFMAEVGRRFGAELRLRSTAGYFDLHWGHAVVVEPRVVEQYGHRAEVRFVALDGMVSNGFQSWAWDGEQAHGGWADDSTIVQVRPGYASGPLRAWRELTDPATVERRREEHAADSLADVLRARQNPYAYLPGLETRLFTRGLVALRDSLAATGLSGAALRAAFLAAYDHARVESSIFAHEGRHTIDRRLGLELELWEREYRAKLSEVAFAPLPRLALRGGIVNANIGDGSPHGRANRRIMEELVAWIDAHRGAIEGLDPTLPLLPQLSLLDDDQLRRAFRSLDPMAAGE